MNSEMMFAIMVNQELDEEQRNLIITWIEQEE